MCLKFHLNRGLLLLVAGLLGSVSSLYAADEAPAQPKASSYAPAEDLCGQVDYYLKHLQEPLADKAQYSQEQQEIVERDSNTLAVLALVLALHDEDHRLKAAAPGILAAAQKLAENTADYDQAAASLAQLTKAVGGEAPADAKAEVVWEAVASMAPLMKQVPVIQGPLERGVTDERRFKRQAAQTAGHAATLAAIAQASQFNTDHAGEDQAEAWQKYCQQMREAAAKVNSAVRGGNAALAAEGLEALHKSCEDCHAVFHPE